MAPVPRLGGSGPKMRRLIPLIALTLAMLLGAWLGGESWLAWQLRGLASGGGVLAVDDLHPRRDPLAPGVTLVTPRLTLGPTTLGFARADLVLAPLAPTRARLDLPATARLALPGGSHELGLGPPAIHARLLPLAGLLAAEASIATGALTLDGQPLASGAEARATLVRLGHDAPPEARTAYDITLALSDLDPAALPQAGRLAEAIPAPRRISLTASGRLWLDRAPAPAALAAAPFPQPVGLRLDAARITIGPASARLLGRIEADDEGRARGAIAIYTTDADRVIAAGAAAGLLPPGAAGLAQGMIRAISAMPMPGDDRPEDPENAAAPHSAPAAGGAMRFPPAAPGELRLPLILEDGRVRLGPIPLGRAPFLRVQDPDAAPG